jgi:hypothetical protein
MANRLLLCCIVVLAGCRTPPTPTPTRPALAPASLGATRLANQVLRVAIGDREVTLNCAVSVQPSSLTIVGTTALGLRAFTVEYDGSRIKADAQAGVPQTLSAERLLNDVQLVFWPLSELQKSLTGTLWSVTEPVPGTRRLRRDGRLVAEVHYTGDAWRSRTWLANLEFGYTLNIDSRAVEP